VLNARMRTVSGKNKVDKLRREGEIPAILYMKGAEPVQLTVDALEFNRVYQEVGTSNLLKVNMEGKEQAVLIREVQRHPFKDDVLHIDFLGVRADETLRVMVPIVLLNRDEIRVQPSILMQSLDEVEVECLPADIPSQAEYDVKEMQIGDVITVEDLDIAKDDKLRILADLTEAVASLNQPEEAKEEKESEEVAAGDVPEIGKEKEEADGE
jgi:large subunit ribosomal protein L25